VSFGDVAHLGTTLPSGSDGQSLVLEIVLTFFLKFVIMGVATDHRIIGAAHDKRFVDPIKSYSPTITPVQGLFVVRDYYFGSYNEGMVHKLTLGGDNFDQVVADEIVYWHGTPWSVIGVFHSPKGQFYVTTPGSAVLFTPAGKAGSVSARSTVVRKAAKGEQMEVGQ